MCCGNCFDIILFLASYFSRPCFSMFFFTFVLLFVYIDVLKLNRTILRSLRCKEDSREKLVLQAFTFACALHRETTKKKTASTLKAGLRLIMNFLLHG